MRSVVLKVHCHKFTPLLYYNVVHFKLTNPGIYLEETARLDVVPSALYRLDGFSKWKLILVEKHKDEDFLGLVSL